MKSTCTSQLGGQQVLPEHNQSHSPPRCLRLPLCFRGGEELLQRRRHSLRSRLLINGPFTLSHLSLVDREGCNVSASQPGPSKDQDGALSPAPPSQPWGQIHLQPTHLTARKHLVPSFKFPAVVSPGVPLLCKPHQRSPCTFMTFSANLQASCPDSLSTRTYLPALHFLFFFFSCNSFSSVSGHTSFLLCILIIYAHVLFPL